MTDQHAGWTDPNPRNATDPRAKTVLTIAGAALTLVVIAALVGVVLIKRGSLFGDQPAGGTVVLAAANAPVPDPFTPSVVVDTRSQSPLIATSIERLPVATDRGVRIASGTQPGLYGGTGQSNACDAAGIANYLDTHADKASAWADALDLSVAQIPYYLNTLTPVILTADTWVTSHSFSDGARPYQTVLQAGNAVLIDPVGVPRVHCTCGNPLLPPENRSLTKLSRVEGDPWSGYNPRDVIAIAYRSNGPQDRPVTRFDLVDVATAQPFTRQAGGTIGIGPITALVEDLPDPVQMNQPPGVGIPSAGGRSTATAAPSTTIPSATGPITFVPNHKPDPAPPRTVTITSRAETPAPPPPPPPPPPVTNTVTVTTPSPISTTAPSTATSEPLTITAIEVTNDLTQPVPTGRRIGPNLYQLGEDGAVGISFGWSAQNARGDYNGDTCQIDVTVEGPQLFSPIKTAQCYGSKSSSFGGANKVEITALGEYTVTVTDAVSGVTGRTSFTVEA